jgi:NAD(P)-dependent dehydrogenase (short-subunit alcohol dehydrogenase family)
MQPEGKIAVVTGAAGGIGGALVRGLLHRGASVVVAADLDEQGAESLGQELGAAVLPRRLDVADAQATEALADEIEQGSGPIDIWFANAGIAARSGPEDSDELWDRQWRVNVMAHVYAARTMLPRWIERGGGQLVTTASMAGILTVVGDAAYAATKHAAVGLAEWLAFTYREQGVRVSCVCPGAVDTAMLRAGVDDRGDAGDDAARASAMIGGGEVLVPDVAAARILDGVAADQFLIFTHPEMQRFVLGKAQEPDRWISGMSRLSARARPQ